MKIDLTVVLMNALVSISTSAGIFILLKTYFIEKIRNAVKHDYDIKLQKAILEMKRNLDKDLESYKSIIKGLESKKLDKWEIKRKACLKALNLADAALSNMDWKKIPGKMVKSEIDTIEVRDCYNQLACSCDFPETLQAFRKVLGLSGEVEIKDITAFRNTIRKELEFGEVNDDDENAIFIGRIHGDNK